MSEMLDLFTALSRPLQAAWLLWLACASLLLAASRRRRRQHALGAVVTASMAPAVPSDTAILPDAQPELDPSFAPEPLPPLMASDPHGMMAEAGSHPVTVPPPVAAAPPIEAAIAGDATDEAIAAEADEEDAALREFEAALESEDEGARRASRERKRNRRARRGNNRAA